MRRLIEPKLVIASHNEGKVREIRPLFSKFGIELVSAAELGLAEPAETEDNFAGNARLKAHAAVAGAGLPALSDDSGIEVDALNGAPGVYTADWAETGTGSSADRDFEMAMTRVWTELNDANAQEPRRARFVCTLCLAWPDGDDLVFRGEVDGRIVWPMRGTLGHGFDPVFLPNGETETFGEMHPDKKNAMSHRARAFAKLVDGCLA